VTTSRRAWPPSSDRIRIISTVLSYDSHEYKKKLDKLSKGTDAPSPEHLDKLTAFVHLDRPTQESLRAKSKSLSKSLPTVIFEHYELTTLSGPSHEISLSYLALSSSKRDRDLLAHVICKSRPDLLTQTVREGISAFDPLLRTLHSGVDLSAGCGDLEAFLNDFVALFETKATPIENTDAQAIDDSELKSEDVSVDQFVQVLRKHQSSLHRFLHRVAANCPTISDQYREYLTYAATHFRASDPKDPFSHVTPVLNALVAGLPSEQRQVVLNRIDDHAAYLMALDCVSTDRLRDVLRGDAKAGPGGYLAMWQELLGETATTPVEPEGEVRYGSTRLGVEDAQVGESWPEKVGGDEVAQELGKEFGQWIAEMGKGHWETQDDDDELD